MRDTTSGINNAGCFSTCENTTRTLDGVLQIILQALSTSDKQHGGAHPYLGLNVVENLLEFDFGKSQAPSTFWWIRIVENNRSRVDIGYDDPMGYVQGVAPCGTSPMWTSAIGASPPSTATTISCT